MHLITDNGFQTCCIQIHNTFNAPAPLSFNPLPQLLMFYWLVSRVWQVFCNSTSMLCICCHTAGETTREFSKDFLTLHMPFPHFSSFINQTRVISLVKNWWSSIDYNSNPVHIAFTSRQPSSHASHQQDGEFARIVQESILQTTPHITMSNFCIYLYNLGLNRDTEIRSGAGSCHLCTWLGCVWTRETFSLSPCWRYSPSSTGEREFRT